MESTDNRNGSHHNRPNPLPGGSNYIVQSGCSLISEYPPTPKKLHPIQSPPLTYNTPLVNRADLQNLPFPHLPHHPSPAQPDHRPKEQEGNETKRATDYLAAPTKRETENLFKMKQKNLNYLIFLKSCIAGLCEQQHLRGYLTLPTYSSLGYLGT